MKKLSSKNQSETKVVCPQCGAQFAIGEHTHVATGIVIGKDAGLGTIHPTVVGQDKPAEPFPGKAVDRIDALRRAGVDVSNYFAIAGSAGSSFVMENKDGGIRVIEDDDPIYEAIRQQGAVPNRKLFRRWVMSKMFRMLYYEQAFKNYSLSKQIRACGLAYSFRQMADEFYAQHKMQKNGDTENFSDRSHWFNGDVLAESIAHYIDKLRDRVEGLKVKHFQGKPYKRIGGRNILLADIEKEVFQPFKNLHRKAKAEGSVYRLFLIASRMSKMELYFKGDIGVSPAWVDAYKGAGAFFTLQNLIRFHGCTLEDDGGVRLSKDASYAYLQAKNMAYKGEGWRMIGLLRKALDDNNIDIKKKMAEWRKK